MKCIVKPARKHLVTILIGIVLILFMEYFGFFDGMSRHGYDLFFRIRGAVEPEKSILLVVIDDSTLNRLGRWPLKRDNYVRLLSRLSQAGAVGLDILMTEPTASDARLAEAVRRHGRVVFPTYIPENPQSAPFHSAFSNLRSGHTHLEPDIDGVIRTVHHTIYHGGRKLPSFASAVYETLPGNVFHREAPAGVNPETAFPPDIVQLDSRNIHFYGPPGTYPRFSFADVLEGRYPPEFFKNRIVLVGINAAGLDGQFLTPFSQRRKPMNGIEVHAHILGNLIEGRQIDAAPESVVRAASVVLAILGLVLLMRMDGGRAIAVWAAAMLAAFLGSLALFAALDIWFSPVLFSVLLLFMFFIAYIVRLEQSKSQLAEAKDMWEDSFHTIDDAIMVTDRSGVPIQMNAAAKELAQDRRLLELLSRKCTEGFKETGKTADAGFRDPFTAMPVHDEIIYAGTARNYSIKTLPRIDGSHRLIGFVQVIQDITEQKRAAREKQRLEAELAQVQKMEAIGTLAGGVAHDFNNILMGIQGYVSLLQIDLPAEDRRYSRLQKIETQVQSAANLTRQLLGFARGGKYEVRPTNLNELLEKTSDMFSRTKKEIMISRRLQENIWLVDADQGQIEQVLLNMYINSWHAMPEGGDLTLTTENVVLNSSHHRSFDIQPGRHVKISVSDTGTGMDEEVRKRVFEPFFTTKEPGKGTGLGLASAYGIIKNHGGFIEVKSAVGEGTTFEIYFPASEKNETTEKPVPAMESSRGRETILLVDDEQENITVMKELLEDLGYRIVCAGSGQEATAVFMMRKDSIDLVILDMVMPGMGGGQTFDALRAIDPGVKVILSSGYSIEGEARSILDRGCNGFIQKPFLINDLSRIIREVLQK
ncbi:MAG: CHASE2 domain-containing protein [Syntrophaceae bacterium]|nr:CHASE2 domain-containing protein [Syntrophaceae bacterium]